MAGKRTPIINRKGAVASRETTATGGSTRENVNTKKQDPIGLAGTTNLESLPDTIQASAEKHEVHAGLRIIKGPYRKKGIATISQRTQQSSMRITAGPLGCMPDPVPEKNEQGETNLLDPDNKLDAATFLITQHGNIQEDFNFAKGTLPARDGLSQIGMKADYVALSGRTGVSIISSTDSRTSVGEDNAVHDINIIAGNDDSKLTPVVRGDQLKKYLIKLSEQLDMIIGCIDTLAVEQININKILSNHSHTVFKGMMTIHPITITGVATPAGTVSGFTTEAFNTTPTLYTKNPDYATLTAIKMSTKAVSEVQKVTKQLTYSIGATKKNTLELSNNIPEFLFSQNVRVT